MGCVWLIVRNYRGLEVDVPSDLFFHVKRRHPEVLSVLNVGSELELFRKVASILSRPHEVYVDREGSEYYLFKINKLFVNVVVYKGKVRTIYLLGLESYYRLRSRRWLFRVF